MRCRWPVAGTSGHLLVGTAQRAEKPAVGEVGCWRGCCWRSQSKNHDSKEVVATCGGTHPQRGADACPLASGQPNSKLP